MLCQHQKQFQKFQKKLMISVIQFCSDDEKVHLLKQKTRINEEIVTINATIKKVKNVLKGNIF